MNQYVPQAIADEKTKQILFVFETKSHLTPFKDKVKTIDAPGVEIHPAEIKVGDWIGFYRTGWDKAKVNGIKFQPSYLDKPYHMKGCFSFDCSDGFKSAFVDGRGVVFGLPLYKFS